jgi:hypothetical protein
MCEYNNILDIYERMCEVSDKMHCSFDLDVLGFDRALYTFQYALKQYSSINLHLENKRLNRELELANDKVLKLKATVTKLTKKK